MSGKSSTVIKHTVDASVNKITTQMRSRAIRASNQLRNAELQVLRGSRNGRMYTVPNTKRKYRASAPGEPPAVRTGNFRISWKPKSYAESAGTGKSMLVHSIIESNATTHNGKNLGAMLENGTPGGKIAPRPYKDKIIEKARDNIVKIYKEPYL